jgi:hypothetical protein
MTAVEGLDVLRVDLKEGSPDLRGDAPRLVEAVAVVRIRVSTPPNSREAK